MTKCKLGKFGLSMDRIFYPILATLKFEIITKFKITKKCYRKVCSGWAFMYKIAIKSKL